MSLDVREILEILRIEVIRERGDEILCHCPVHVQMVGKEDRNPSFWINRETGANLCFSCGWKGSVFSLVGTVRELFDENDNIDYEQVKKWLANVNETTVEELSLRLKKMPDYVALPEPVPMSEARLALFVEPPQWALESRNITAEACRKHQVLWKEKTHQWILPLRDPHTNELLGWQEKFQKPDEKFTIKEVSLDLSHKFRNRPPGLKKSKTLFGVQNMRHDKAIVVESPLDVVRLDSIGIEGGVALLGASVSVDQIRLLRSCDIVISALDNPSFDVSGKKGSEAILKLGKQLGMELKFFNYNKSTAKDIGEMSEEDIRFGLMNAKDMIYGEQAYV